MKGIQIKGFTLIEVIIAIGVVALLAGIITPSVIKHLDDAKRARALNDCQVIGAAIASFYKDVGKWPRRDSSSGYNLVLLAGEGDTPGSSGGGTRNWVLPTTAGNADKMAYHLTSNRPKNSNSNAYATRGELKWRGPYQTSFPADPWGYRYAVNIGSMGPRNVVWVISAGPDGVVQTSFNQRIPNSGVVDLRGDDIGFRLN